MKRLLAWKQMGKLSPGSQLLAPSSQRLKQLARLLQARERVVPLLLAGEMPQQQASPPAQASVGALVARKLVPELLAWARAVQPGLELRKDSSRGPRMVKSVVWTGMRTGMKWVLAVELAAELPVPVSERLQPQESVR